MVCQFLALAISFSLPSVIHVLCTLLQTSNLLNVARNRENTESLVDRKMVTKPGAVTQRAALGNISNKGVISSATDGVKVLIDLF